MTLFIRNKDMTEARLLQDALNDARAEGYEAYLVINGERYKIIYQLR